MSTNKPELVICRGLPASGKTTYAEGWVAFDHKNRVRVNKDDLRAMMDNGVYLDGITEFRIIKARDLLIQGLLAAGVSVISDDCNMRSFHYKKLARIAHIGGWEWRIQDFNVPVEECVKRNIHRTRLENHEKVPNDAIRTMNAKYSRVWNQPLPTPADLVMMPGTGALGIPYVSDPSLPRAIIVDIDGTVANMGTRGAFDESRVHEDRPHQDIIDLIRADCVVNDAEIIFMSGRTEACYDETFHWLEDNVTQAGFTLLMRPVGDSRKDAIMKLELFDKYVRGLYNILRVYDDRNQVVEMWRGIGLRVLQVADGAF